MWFVYVCNGHNEYVKCNNMKRKIQASNKHHDCRRSFVQIKFCGLNVQTEESKPCFCMRDLVFQTRSGVTMSSEQPLSEGTSPEMEKKYREILQSNGITDAVSKVVVKDSGLKGEGFASLTQYVTVHFEDSDTSPLNLFVKGFTSNESHREMIKASKAFEKEARFFMEYIPEAAKLCQSKGQNELLDIYPKCYYGDDDIIVLENLVLEKGFVLLDKEEMQTLEQAQWAMKTLAKHHAISIAMIKKYDGATKFFERFPNLNFNPFIQSLFGKVFDKAFDSGITTNLALLEKYDTEGRDECVKKLKSYIGKVFDLVMDILKEPVDNEPLLVLNHGDYWNNNMMVLKDKESGKITQHKTIDLQMTRYNSPLLDIGYFMFTSVKPDIRRLHMRDLLQEYLKTLKNIAADLDCTVDVSDEELWKLSRKKFKPGYWHGICVASGLGFFVAKDVDIETMGDVSEWGTLFEKMCNIWIENHPEKAAVVAKEMIKYVEEYNELLEQ